MKMTPRGRVSPFGNPRIKACSRLPAAYRSVPRPSSPPRAKASTRCPSQRLARTAAMSSEQDRKTETGKRRPGTGPETGAPTRPSRPVPGPPCARSHARPATCHDGNPCIRFLAHSPCQRTLATPAPPSRKQARKTTPMKTPPANAPPAAEAGGANRVRTGDLLLAKQALSQLSYGPARKPESRRPIPGWWAEVDSNHRPHAYQACALTT